MVDQRKMRKCADVLSGLAPDDVKMWLDCTDNMIIHEIDTFYFTVTLHNNFLSDTDDYGVKTLRRDYEKYYHAFKKNYTEVPLDIGGVPCLAVPGSFAGMYKLLYRVPDKFDMFVAPEVPPQSAGSDSSVTAQVVVQLRSVFLWDLGVSEAYNEACRFVRAWVYEYGFAIDQIKENRMDFCFHSNYLSNPDKFFSAANLSEMVVSHLRKSASHIIVNWKDDAYETSYVTFGKRGGSIYVRIYDKVREVLEMHYKPWFFQRWLFSGMINRYDFYVFSEAYKIENARSRVSFINIARCKWAYTYGRIKDQELLSKLYQVVHHDLYKDNEEALEKLADTVSPPVTRVFNIEFQVSRRWLKKIDLPDVPDVPRGSDDYRIWQVLYFKQLLSECLTRDVFRLVKPGTATFRKDRLLHPFWERIQHTKLLDSPLSPAESEICRNYTRRLDKEMVKSKFINAAISYGLYDKGFNCDSIYQDCVDVLSMINDNDIHNAFTTKQRKISQANRAEFSCIVPDERLNKIIMVDENGVVFESTAD